MSAITPELLEMEDGWRITNPNLVANATIILSKVVLYADDGATEVETQKPVTLTDSALMHQLVEVNRMFDMLPFERIEGGSMTYSADDQNDLGDARCRLPVDKRGSNE